MQNQTPSEDFSRSPALPQDADNSPSLSGEHAIARENAARERRASLRARILELIQGYDLEDPDRLWTLLHSIDQEGRDIRDLIIAGLRDGAISQRDLPPGFALVVNSHLSLTENNAEQFREVFQELAAAFGFAAGTFAVTLESLRRVWEGLIQDGNSVSQAIKALADFYNSDPEFQTIREESLERAASRFRGDLSDEQSRNRNYQNRGLLIVQSPRQRRGRN